ncbi:MAG TPA: hypothetical protein VGM07_12605 [Stellaceae bacterium]|jgi:hypothetical protein
MQDTRDTRAKPPKRAETPRQRAEKEVLRARQVPGKIDHAELTREIISRFPKILAKLAE